MGYMRHHAIIVTSFLDELVIQAHAKAKEFGATVTEITGDRYGYRSFLVAPDGSKEGWDESNRGDYRRERLTQWLDAQRHCDDSTSIDWVEVQYGDDDNETRIVRDGDRHRREQEARAVGGGVSD